MTPAVPDLALAGTEWNLVELNGREAIAVSGERRPHLRFLGDGSRLEGATGCNVLSGEYDARGARLHLSGPLVTTKMACMQQGVNAQEREFLQALETMERYEISGRTLTLYSSSGAEIAKLTAAP